MKKKTLVILGSTGSIGEQSLEVIDKHYEQFEVLGLAAYGNVVRLAEQIEKYHPQYAVIGDENKYKALKEKVNSNTEIIPGIEGLRFLASLDAVDIVLQAVSGAIGIASTVEAVKAGKRIALANKESLVAAGDIIMPLVPEFNAELIPVDSEHSAIFQCLKDEERCLERIWLTASGGPFRDYSSDELSGVTAAMALKHPTWQMGPKITIDSATLMNKGLEVIEAHHLFTQAYDKIKVLIQKESLIHSMVEFVDGSFIAHLGAADMRIPIQYALTYPDRQPSPAKHVDFYELQSIHFAAPDLERFPCLRLAYEAGSAGGTIPAVLNAANEVAVNNFILGKLSFNDIYRIVEKVIVKHDCITNPQLTDIYSADAWAREYCLEILKKEGN